MAGIHVNPPAAKPRLGGLLSVAEIVDVTDVHEFAAGIEHEPDVCGLARHTPDVCWNTFVTAAWDAAVDPAPGVLTVTVRNPIAGRVYTLLIDGSVEDTFTPGVGGSTATFDIDMGDTPAPMVIEVREDGTLTIFSLTATLPAAADAVLAGTPEKDADDIEHVHGTPFALQSSVECYLMDGGTRTNVERVRAKLELTEGRGIEEWFWESVLRPQAVDLTPTPGTSVDILEAVKILEQAAAEAYGGAPIVHATVGAVIEGRASDAFFNEGGNIHTVLGTEVVAGAGYGSLADAGLTEDPDNVRTGWMYVTGPVQVRRGPIETHEVPTPVFNRARALAERKYIVTADCFVFAVLVDW